MITYGGSAIYPMHRGDQKWINSAIYQCVKNVYGIYGNPSQTKMHTLLNLPMTKEMLWRTKKVERMIETTGSKQPRKEMYQTPIILNFIHWSEVKRMKWKKRLWIWRINPDQDHLLNWWPDERYALWRDKWRRIMEIDKLDDLEKLMKVGCTTRKEVNTNTIEKLIIEYNEILKFLWKNMKTVQRI